MRPIWATLFAGSLLLNVPCPAGTRQDVDIAPLSKVAAADRSTGSLYDERDLLKRFYEARRFEPAWISDGWTLAALAVTQLQLAPAHGLIASDYNPSEFKAELAQPGGPRNAIDFDARLSLAVLRLLADLHAGRTRSGPLPSQSDLLRDFDPAIRLQTMLVDGRIASAADDAAPQLAIYGRLRAALAVYRSLAEQPQVRFPVPGGWPIAPGMPYAEVDILRQRLRILGDLAPEAAEDHGGIYTPELAEAVKRFQDRHGLDADGELGPRTVAALNVPLTTRVRQIEMALERLRWLPAFPVAPLIAINVPSYRLWAFETTVAGAAPSLTMRVIVGKAARHQTPVFVGAVRYVEFNPYWNVPPSIARAEIHPALLKDPDYLKRHDMELIDTNGAHFAAADARALASLRAGSMRVRQRPGPQNALGTLKFGMPNPMNIYLHGTPAVGLFQATRRDFSHGCIRVEHPSALAAFVLSGQPQWTGTAIPDAIAAGRNRTVRLHAALPVVIFYTTAIADSNGRALFPGDIYNLDVPLARTLARRSAMLRRLSERMQLRNAP